MERVGRDHSIGAGCNLGPIAYRHYFGRHLWGHFSRPLTAAVAAVYAFIASFVYRDMGPFAGREGEANTPVWAKPRSPA